jgi:mannose-1-phosphate guanylyltransferase
VNLSKSLNMSTLVNVVLSGNAPGIASMDHFVLAWSGKSLFQLCMERNAPFSDRQLVIGHNDFYIAAKANLKLAGNRTYLSIIEEDHLTNLYSAAFAAFSAGSEEVLLVTPSHYMIGRKAAYKGAIDEAIQLAEQDMIAVIAFKADQAAEYMPFITSENNKITAITNPLDSKQAKALAKDKTQLAHSGIICCKAGVYLKELKTLAPEIFKAAQITWKTRVGQYVAAEARTKIPYVTLEEIMLTTSDKVTLVLMSGTRAEASSKNGNGKTVDNDPSASDPSSHNGGLHSMGLAL